MQKSIHVVSVHGFPKLIVPFNQYPDQEMEHDQKPRNSPVPLLVTTPPQV